MSIETAAPSRSSASLRTDAPGVEAVPRDSDVFQWTWPTRLGVLTLLAAGFVLFGGAGLDLGPIESRLGLSAFENFGPLGRVYGGWEPSIWPAQLGASLVWAWGEGGTPTSASVRWPSAIAGVAIGLILARAASKTLGGRAGVLAGLCWFGTVGLIDRSAGAGIDLITGLGTILTLDRVLRRGSDLLAGSWLAFAFLAEGWPPVALVVLASIVLGRREAAASWRLLLPPFLAIMGWSAWALAAMPAEVWASALALPLTQKPAWLLAPAVCGLALPWSPLVLLAASRSVRDGWSGTGRALSLGWLSAAGACLVAGTIVPGLALAAKVPAMAGLAVVSGSVLDRILAGTFSSKVNRWFLGISAVLTLFWHAIVVLGGGYLAAAIPCYRLLSIGLSLLCLPVSILASRSAARRDVRGGFGALLALAVMLKVAHSGYYVPEWNYRLSQGPWGRAVGQWVPPGWPIHTIHSWRTDFAFATGHPVRQLVAPQHLQYQPGDVRFVLLLQSEYENWPELAPKLESVATFQDEYGGARILARTAGELPWTRLRRAIHAE